jgi:hypothetical protein
MRIGEIAVLHISTGFIGDSPSRPGATNAQPLDNSCRCQRQSLVSKLDSRAVYSAQDLQPVEIAAPLRLYIRW